MEKLDMLEMEAKDKVREKIGGKLPSPKRCPLITSKETRDIEALKAEIGVLHKFIKAQGNSNVEYKGKMNMLKEQVVQLREEMRLGRKQTVEEEQVQVMKHQILSLQQAFGTLSDLVVDEMDWIRKDVMETCQDIKDRMDNFDRHMTVFKVQVNDIVLELDQQKQIIESNGLLTAQQVEQVENTLKVVQENMMEYDCNKDSLEKRYEGMSRRLDDITVSSDQVVDWVSHLKTEANSTHQFLCTLNKDFQSTTNGLAAFTNNLEVLSGQMVKVQQQANVQHQQHQECIHKLETELRENKHSEHLFRTKNLETMKEALRISSIKTVKSIETLANKYDKVGTVVQDKLHDHSHEISRKLETVLSSFADLSKRTSLVQNQTSQASSRHQRHIDSLSNAFQSMTTMLNLHVPLHFT